MPEKRLVIFDLDNTLVINKPAAKAAYEAAIRFLSKETKLEFNKLNSYWKKSVQRLQQESAPEKRAFEYSLALVFDKYNIPERLMSPTLNLYEKELIQKIEPMPGAREIVSWLKEQNALVAVAAGTDRGLAKKKLKNTNLYEYIDAIVCAADVGSMKPDSGYYQQIMDELEVNSKQTLVVSDSIDEDINQAKKMGLKTIKLDAVNPHLSSLKDELSTFLTFAS